MFKTIYRSNHFVNDLTNYILTTKCTIGRQRRINCLKIKHFRLIKLWSTDANKLSFMLRFAFIHIRSSNFNMFKVIFHVVIRITALTWSCYSENNAEPVIDDSRFINGRKCNHKCWFCVLQYADDETVSSLITQSCNESVFLICFT